ncbi:sporulation transcriptional regulator SpoIIID [Clostridium cochlearium]|uniref:sporulation transcriptional regulator SpoIIID n=1 Tax=Clostridium cochlearium TaxID=1494 RepID=UPI00180C8F61|nr:sporulation transcriptional regulator SpoIIID [Clostridium cochlearium]NMA58828.1 stage III sporulation protein D [Clostridium cochlearium]
MRKYNLDKYVSQRALEVGRYLICTKTTTRKVAKVFGVSKTTICKDLKRLFKIDRALAIEAKKVLNYNSSQKSFRGGQSTKLKYQKNMQ